MNTNTHETAPVLNLADLCVACCQKIVSQINEAKDRMLAEFRDRFGTYDQAIRLALNEAEALAWQTSYPQLFFPDLAAEKIQAVANWSAHQRSSRRANPALSLRP